MTKRDLANEVATKFDITKREATETVDFLFDRITGALKRKDRVSIPGFGIFSVRDRAARMGRNPQTGEAIQIPARTRVGFRAAKDLKEAVGVKPRKRPGR